MNKFPGFPPEGQYWQFPSIINGYINLLSGSEFKVLWYILRHTYGFQKTSDAISISQIMKGIIKGDGTVFDSGTGIKHRTTVVSAIKKLASLGFIEYKSGAGKGKPNIYYPIITTPHKKPTSPKKPTPPHTKNRPLPPLKNRPTINNTINNPINNTSKKKLTPRKVTERLVEAYNKKFDSSTRITNKKIKMIKVRLKSYEPKELWNALARCSTSPFHRGENDRGWVANFEYIYRNDEQVDKCLNLKVHANEKKDTYKTPDGKKFYNRLEWIAYCKKKGWEVSDK